MINAGNFQSLFCRRGSFHRTAELEKEEYTMKFKRGISLALALALIAGIGGPLDIRAAAADTGSSDALAALGIDSSKAPDGFNANDPSNPYGRNTIKVTPVYELYTVGLTSDVLPSDTISMGTKATQKAVQRALPHPTIRITSCRARCTAMMITHLPRLSSF
ncbi:hypothetical protein DXB00_10150 [Butyricicoccus sp. OF10-2]|nr:hypothetical protein DXB00_10150 [Butyricicoccus sp. OF10-2]